MATQEAADQAGVTPMKGGRGKKNIEIESEYENMMSEQLDTISDNSPSKNGNQNTKKDKKDMKIKQVENKRGLTMGKKAIVLDTALT